MSLRHLSHVVLAASLVLLSGCSAAGSSSASTGASSSSSGGTSIIAPVTTDVGPMGGTVTSGAASVTIPKDALAKSTAITIEPAPAGIAPLPDGMSPIGEALAFLPHGLEFASAPVVITLPQDGTADTVLRLSDEADTTWEEVTGAVFGATTVTFATTHFSIYVLTGRCTALCKIGEKSCPNPIGAGNACRNACNGNGLPPSSLCAPQAEALAQCYLPQPLTAWECPNGVAWLKSTVCPTEYAAVEACLKGSTPPAACAAGWSGAWHLPPQAGSTTDMYFVVLSDRTAICADDGPNGSMTGGKSGGGFGYTCASPTQLTSNGGVCGWDSGSSVTMTLTAPTAKIDVVRSGAPLFSATLANVALASLPSWCVSQIDQAKSIPAPVPKCP